MATPDDVLLSCMAGRRGAIVPDTDSARALAAELEALPLGEFLARCREIRRKHGDTAPEHVSAVLGRALEQIKPKGG